jgi:glycosyltransferase involved in cell wall biosynthesis
MTEPFLSVVTPVYNDAEYLEQCIKSVLVQSHQDFEYIICNNHSKDRSGEIAQDYAANDPRVRVVKPPEFLPQAKNFNFSLQQISPRSQHCKMVLSDDWIYPNCIRELTEVAEANPRIALRERLPIDRNEAGLFRRSGGAQSLRAGTLVVGSCSARPTHSGAKPRSFLPGGRAESGAQLLPRTDFFDVDVAFRILATRRSYTKS